MDTCLPSVRRDSRWNGYTVAGVDIDARTPSSRAFPADILPPQRLGRIPRHFWNRGIRAFYRRRLLRTRKYVSRCKSRPLNAISTSRPDYAEAGRLIGQGTIADLDRLSTLAQELVSQIFEDSTRPSTSFSDSYTISSSLDAEPGLVKVRLSPELEQWKREQHAAGKVLPPKGKGLAPASDEVLAILQAKDWPEALKTNNALFGCGIASLLMGAADARTLFSNYVTDMVFYYEHGYDHVFPSLSGLLEKGLEDSHARRTPGGRERRDGVRIGKRYIQHKIALEVEHKAGLKNVSARLDRKTAQIISLSESSLFGMAAEVTARGFDPAAVMSDLVFSSPGTDVVDVGCDLVNSEVMNSFLNVADVSIMGVASEEVLRRVYDAYAATGARMLTQRWYEPIPRMCAALYTWHIQNDRHMFLRRAILGWPKARQKPARPCKEADFDEVFDKDYHTTGFSRPLDPQYACDGTETCDKVRAFLVRNWREPLLGQLWAVLVTEVLDYVRGGQVDGGREARLCEESRVCMAKLYSRGLVLEMVWLIAHASHHAWQINYLFEAAMFGSLLDQEKLAGKLDRAEGGEIAEEKK